MHGKQIPPSAPHKEPRLDRHRPVCHDVFMDIDRFFTLGSGLPFQANDIFTDREQHIDAFRKRAVAHCSKSWTAAMLTDFQRQANNIVTFIGDGGIGKSTLVRHLARLSVDHELPGLPHNCASAVLDFADASNQSFETVLLRVRAAFGGLGSSWSAFDIALSLYWERKHPGESLIEFLRKSSSIGKAADALQLSDQIASTIDGLLGGFGVISIAYRLANLVGQAASQKITVKRLREDMPAFEALIEERDPDRMLGYLPVLLAYDLERIHKKDPVLALILLDTLEGVQALPAERRGLEDLISRLVYLMPNAFFIAASRRPLLWHDPVRSVGLTYGGELRWPGLAGAHGSSDQFILHGFDDVSADQYLQERLTQDNSPLIPAVIRRRIIDGASGSPHYLELSAGLFEQIAARGEDPAPEIFGQPFPELVLRMMRDLSSEDRDLLRAAALLEACDEQILGAIVPQARGRLIQAFLERSFVRRSSEVWPPYRLHENLRRGVTLCDDHTTDGWTETERRRNVLRATTYLERLILSIWNDDQGASSSPSDEPNRRAVAAFLLSLYAAHEHEVLPPGLGHMAYTLHELGHWQVLASLPNYTDGASWELMRLIEVARLAARGDVNARPRYQQMKVVAGDLGIGAYAPFIYFHLGNTAFFGELDESDRYFAAIANDSSAIGSGAVFGLAGNALRQSRFGDVVALMRRPGKARLEQTRVADMLGHLEMHNGRFEEAVQLFKTALDHARHARAPLWIGRATRHLALAYMWFDPDRALELIPEARELNQALGDGVGIAQCAMASSLVHACHGEWSDADRLLAEARSGLKAVGATFEMLPVESIEVLIYQALGRTARARAVTRRLITDSRAGQPLGPPVWAAVTALWVDHPEWYDFDSVDWIEPTYARDRWRAPLVRLRSTTQAKDDISDATS